MKEPIFNDKIKEIFITLIEDNKDLGYTAISSDHPEVISEGNTEGQAIANFGKMLDVVYYGSDGQKTTSNHIDNFDLIGSMLDFTLPNTMYFVQTLQRRKDNPTMVKDVRVINNYYIYSNADLIKLKNKIIEDCTKYNARAYINLNRLDTERIGLCTQKIIAEYLLNQQYVQIKNAYASACGTYHSEKNKRWVVDIDTKDENEIQLVSNFIKELYTEAKSTNRIINTVPTKNGVHLICEGFRMDHFSKRFPGMSVHKNSPTILYIN